MIDIMRVGHGYDIHKLAPDRKLIIGGVEIPHSKGLSGHSDADVLVHALIDAMLGALGLGDIGKHFPDSDMKWKDANSLDLLSSIYNLIKSKGFKITNIDSTIVVEKPKLSPYIDKMKNNLSKILEISSDLVNIKAKTNEEQDSVGQEKAICAWVVILIE